MLAVLAAQSGRLLLIGAMAFLTVVDLFAAQAILPALTSRYGVTPAVMSVAVNATTVGMAGGSFGIALISRHIDRRRGIVISLLLLGVPTLLLGLLPALPLFALLRVMQGFCMASAFTLALAYLGETAGRAGGSGAFAAYITGNVASNLVGRLISAGVADHFGLAANFYVFAALNVAGALLAAVAVRGGDHRMPDHARWTSHLTNAPLAADFAIGFCLLFAFIGTFTFINFVLARPPLSLGMMQTGFVYFVFLPSIVTTPFAAAAASRLGARGALLAGLAVALVGLPLLALPSLPLVLTGMVLVACGTFFAQACATAFIGRVVMGDRGTASGIYLACYYLGGLVGSILLGVIFDTVGWGACLSGIAIALLIAVCLVTRLKPSSPRFAQSSPIQERTP